jgi:Fe-S cluster assembly ATP-binding protein
MLLEIKDLRVRAEDKEILKGLTLSVNAGEVHAIMGPNGSGKSTLARALSGHPGYEVTGGSVSYKGQDLLAMDPEVRAAEGVFMAFQYPVEIAGVNNAYFLQGGAEREAQAPRRARLDAMEFMQLVQEKASCSTSDKSMLSARSTRVFGRREEAQRDLPDGAARAASSAILDETDSGLDIDALKLVANGVNAHAFARTRASSSSPTISGCSTTSCPTSCTC